MLMRCLLFSILALLACCQVYNYQERCIYYSQADNACREIPDQLSDYVNIIININDQSRIRRTVYGGTQCSDWPLRYADRIFPGRGFFVVDRSISLYMEFQEVATRKYTFGLLSSLILKETIKNPGRMYGNDYECTIFGDGTVQHYGSGNGRPPAEIYLRCVPTSQMMDSQQEETGNLIK